jgi:uncharacterized protein YkwD
MSNNAVGPGVGVRRAWLALALVLCLTLGTLAASASPAEAGIKHRRHAVVEQVNKIRLAHGCAKVKLRTALNRAAQRHARDMSVRDYFSHTSANGTQWFVRIRQAGWPRPAGENIAYGFRTARGVVRAWMASPGHRRNILDCKFRYMGVGYAVNGRYWVQDFGYNR